MFNKKEVQDQEKSVKDWLPVKDIADGIVILKNGDYAKILEVIPINFKLKSKNERRLILLNFRGFLKACRFPIQVSVQCRKADVEPHVKRMEEFYKREVNENVRHMLKGYISLVRTLGIKGAVSRRFFLVIPYVAPAGVKTIPFVDVVKQFEEKKALVKEYLKKCGNPIADTGDTEFTAKMLYTCLNRRTCEVQKFTGKLIDLTGVLSGVNREECV